MKKYGILIIAIMLFSLAGCSAEMYMELDGYDPDDIPITTGHAVDTTSSAGETQRTTSGESTSSTQTSTPTSNPPSTTTTQEPTTTTSALPTTTTTGSTAIPTANDVVQGYIYPDNEDRFIIQFEPTEKVEKVTIELRNSTINSLDNADIFHWNDDRTLLTVTADLRIRNPDGSWTIVIGPGYLATIEGSDIVYDGTYWKKIN